MKKRSEHVDVRVIVPQKLNPEKQGLAKALSLWTPYLIRGGRRVLKHWKFKKEPRDNIIKKVLGYLSETLENPIYQFNNFMDYLRKKSYALERRASIFERKTRGRIEMYLESRKSRARERRGYWQEPRSEELEDIVEILKNSPRIYMQFGKLVYYCLFTDVPKKWVNVINYAAARAM